MRDGTPDRAFVVGASYRTADSRIRDRLYIEPGAVPDFLATAKAAGLTQAFALSTCDRVEVIGASPDPESACIAAERLLLSRLDGVSAGSDTIYRLSDTDAVRHVFRIAAALDSQMVGESQILGQLKDAVQVAPTGAGELDRLTQAAFALAKRVRSTTRIGEGAVSAAAAAVKVAQDLHGPLDKCRALLIGLGETGALIADQFLRAGLGVLNLTGPARRTEREAARRGWTYHPFDRLDEALANADIVITAAGRGTYLIDRARMDHASTRRRHKPILVVDAGIPSDVDPDTDRIRDVFLYSLADIERLAEKGQLDRKAEALEAEAMVEAALVDWRRAQAEREGVPGLVALRDHFETLRDEVLRRHPNADPTEATRLLVNRLLHEPSECLREIAKQGSDADLRDTITVNRVLERLFALTLDNESKNKNELDG
ncbi:glutamyl-tRNA reductase [Rhodospirillaceae bacterium KN72]|uniref:Glutamyl-tRNA reductase n=1 Tax=Pacificispira spongiicola TaxID=2729598 RepID=A0A7Y0DY71_9PROT|nr:glutamyl-tRNA reductase [Pacificispira spongiicola]NMM43784.1 glutamyl-tRNA reductase [Pacificispira spongiicola]